MNEQHATRRIASPAGKLHAILTRPAALPDWNPAVHSLAGNGQAQTGQRYRITARGGLSGYLDYPAIRADRVEIHIKVHGLEEHGFWQLSPQGAATLVEHGFHHLGPLAMLLSAAYRGVAELRLDRLAERARAPK